MVWSSWTPPPTIPIIQKTIKKYTNKIKYIKFVWQLVWSSWTPLLRQCPGLIKMVWWMVWALSLLSNDRPIWLFPVASLVSSFPIVLYWGLFMFHTNYYGTDLIRTGILFIFIYSYITFFMCLKLQLIWFQISLLYVSCHVYFLQQLLNLVLGNPIIKVSWILPLG